ncbi:TetR/AcrR family transcriptional regulator [bacterium]|nr:TetR/AcrR family transcriptional regulator [bacterium]
MTAKTYQTTTNLVENIIRSAAERFKKYGYGKTTVNEIAADLHISKKTLYAIFPSKEEIVREVAWRETVEIIRKFNYTVPTDMKSDSLLIALCRFIFLDRIKNGKTGLFRGIYSEDLEIRKAFTGALSRVIATLYEDGIKRGLLKPLDPVFAASVVVNMVDTATGYFHAAEQPVQMFDGALRLIADAVSYKDRIAFNAMG